MGVIMLNNPPAFNGKQIMEYEHQLLGAYILGASIGDGISESVFLTTGHKTVFPIIRELKTSGLSLDIMILAAELQKRDKLDSVGGAAYVADLTTAASVATSAAASSIVAARHGKSDYCY